MRCREITAEDFGVAAVALNLYAGRKPGMQQHGRGPRSNPERRGSAPPDRCLDGGLQHRASTFPAGLLLTPGVHHALVPTRRVSGLTGVISSLGMSATFLAVPRQRMLNDVVV
jgi:hypothetical protein